MSELSTTNGNNAVVQHSGDPFSSYGAKVGTQGVFLTFKAGEYLYGQDGRTLQLGSKLAANMAGLRIGWRRWWDDQVTDDQTELLSDQRPIPIRTSLGDNDQSVWKKDKEGRPFDPWQLTNVLELIDGEGERYTYSTGSRGGINAIGRLCKEYGKLYRQKPGMVPIVELGNDYYMHKEFGKTYVPDFKIVAWADEDTLTIHEEQPISTAEIAQPKQPSPSPEPSPAANKKARF